MHNQKISPFFLTTVLHILAIMVSAFMDGPLKWYLLISLFSTFGILLVLGVVFPRMNFFLKTICRIKPGLKRVCLTFDDGPDIETTPFLLDLLAEQRVHATFFCVGKHICAHPKLLKRIDAEGHLVGNHSFHHHWWTNFLLAKGLQREIQKTQKIIREILGKAPRYFRSPMGLTNPHLKRALKETGQVLVGWDIHTFDRKANSPKTVIKRALKAVQDGSIILLHDGGVKRDMLLSITRELILELQKRGFSFAKIDS